MSPVSVDYGVPKEDEGMQPPASPTPTHNPMQIHQRKRSSRFLHRLARHQLEHAQSQQVLKLRRWTRKLPATLGVELALPSGRHPSHLR